MATQHPLPDSTTPPPDGSRPPLHGGLTAVEVANRRARGEDNRYEIGTGRSYPQIVRANLFSFFNNILFAIGIALILLGQYADALLSVGLGVLNAIVATAQEIRAKRQLDRIALLTQPRVLVIRDGLEQSVHPGALVLGDLIVLRSGEQAVVDGAFRGSDMVEMDESLLTGETDLVRKEDGARILSGSFCITGTGHYIAESVGADSYANQITAGARAYQVSYTPLQRNVNFIVRLVMLIVAMISVITFAAALIEGLPFTRLVQMAAVLTGLVPYGLFTMIVVGYALGAAKIAQRGALVQQTNAVESLSNIDVLCMDKTGTLTTNELRFAELAPLAATLSRAEAERLVGRFVRSAGTNNRTSEALVDGLPGAAQAVVAEIPFASVRKWGALAFADGVYALGAIETLAPFLPQAALAGSEPLAQLAAAWSEQGLRVLLFAGNARARAIENDTLPALTPLALICLRDELRPFAAETLDAFAELGIALKIISGDNSVTVAALARQAGLQNFLTVSGADLAHLDESELRQIAAETTVFGRISPGQKQALVQALIDQGHYVAMVGDGVNDVLSLKKAQVGIAMQSGSQATRNVADMVLLDDSFVALRPAFSEGRNIIGGLTRSMYLFLVRVVASTLVIIAAAMLGLSFPFEPAQVGLTLFTVGIPAFCLTLWASPLRLDENVLRSLVRFVVPASLLVLLFALTIYTTINFLFANSLAEFEIPLQVVQLFEARTGLVYQVDDTFTGAAATIVAQSFLSVFLAYTAFVLILFLEPPRRWFEGWTRLSPQRWPTWMAAGLWLIFTAVVVWEPSSSYFGLVPIPLPALLLVWLLVGVWALVLRQLWRIHWLERMLGM